jgi:periplasmic divalent cation tolerance protein
MSIPSHVVVLVTLPLGVDAGGFARTLVEERLAACVSVSGEIRSVYRWEGQVAEDGERQLFIKTTSKRLSALLKRVQEIHSHSVPEFLVLPVFEGEQNYLKWISEST